MDFKLYIMLKSALNVTIMQCPHLRPHDILNKIVKLGEILRDMVKFHPRKLITEIHSKNVS